MNPPENQKTNSSQVNEPKECVPSKMNPSNNPPAMKKMKKTPTEIVFTKRVCYTTTLTFREFQDLDETKEMTPEEKKKAWASLCENVETGDYDDDIEEEDEECAWTSDMIESAVNDVYDEVMAERKRAKEVCDYCEEPVAFYQCFGRFKTCETHATRPHEEMEKQKKKEETEDIVDEGFPEQGECGRCEGENGKGGTCLWNDLCARCDREEWRGGGGGGGV